MSKHQERSQRLQTKQDEAFATAVVAEAIIPEAEVSEAQVFEEEGAVPEAINLPTFADVTPDVSKSCFSSVPFLGVLNVLMIGLIVFLIKYLIDGELNAVLYAAPVVTLAYLGQAFYLHKSDECEKLSPQQAQNLLDRHRESRPIAEMDLKCYHDQKTTESTSRRFVTFKTIEYKNLADFVDVSPNLKFQDGSKHSRFVKMKFRQSFAPVDEITRENLHHQEQALMDLHRDKDEKIMLHETIYTDEKIPHELLVDRSPDKPLPISMSGAITCVATAFCCAFPMRLAKGRLYKRVTYHFKKLISTEALDNGYKDFIEQERGERNVFV